MKNDRELYASLAYLADTLVSGFDLVDLSDRLVHSCLELLDVSAAGMLLTDQRGSLQVFASSSQEMKQLELLQLQSNQGRCYDAFVTGETVGPVLLADADARWPRFAFRARETGFATVLALPMRLRESTIGAINLFTSHPRGLTPEDIDAARAMANMATIGILTHRVTRRREILAEQLQTALNSRVVIEQAKGIIAEREGVEMADAFEMLRSIARSSRRPLSEVADDVARGRLPTPQE